MAIDVLKQRTLMNVHDARNAFIQELHSYLSEHYSNTPKLAITMDCTNRIADIVLYIHCTNDQWYIVAVDIAKIMNVDNLRKTFVMATLSEEEEVPQSNIKYFCLDGEATRSFEQLTVSLKNHIF